MALSATTVWEVQTGGSDLNGGAFYTVAGGSDYSQVGATPHVAFDGTTIYWTAAGAGLTIKIYGYTVATTDKGNSLRVPAPGDANQTAGVYCIASVVTGAEGTQSWTLVGAGNVCTGAVTAGTGRMGGSLLTIGAAVAAGNVVNGNTVWVKEGAYSVSANIVAAEANYGQQNRIQGYSVTRGDGGRPTITATAGCTTVLSHAEGGVWSFVDLIVDCADIANIGIANNNNYSANVTRCKVTRFAQYGIDAFVADRCEVSNGKAGSTAGLRVLRNARNNYVHDNPCTGIYGLGAAPVIGNVVCNNTGATSDGIYFNSYGANQACNNICFGNGRDGIRFDSYAMCDLCYDNILVNNVGNGIRLPPYGTRTDQFDNNAFYGNGARTDRAGSVDIVLTANPFVNSAAADFRLNTTAGGGAACRAAGVAVATYAYLPALGAIPDVPVYPAAGEVWENAACTEFGPTGVDYTPTRTDAAAADVKAGVKYGDPDSQLTGTLAGGIGVRRGGALRGA